MHRMEASSRMFTAVLDGILSMHMILLRFRFPRLLGYRVSARRLAVSLSLGRPACTVAGKTKRGCAPQKETNKKNRRKAPPPSCSKVHRRGQHDNRPGHPSTFITCVCMASVSFPRDWSVLFCELVHVPQACAEARRFFLGVLALLGEAEVVIKLSVHGLL